MEEEINAWRDAMTDAELVAHVQEDAEGAFEELVRRYEARVYGLARCIVANAEDARDLAQEVFVRAWRSIDRVDPARRFESWLCTITVNVCRSHLRRRRVPARLANADAIPQPGIEETDDRRVTALREALAALAPKYRIALVLFHQEGRSTRQVAELMKVSPGRVRIWLHRGRRLLRESMSRRGFACHD